MVVVDAYWTLEPPGRDGVVRLRRTGAPFAKLAEVGPSFAAAKASIAPYATPRYALIVDFRAGPPARHDAEFHAIATPFRRTMFAGFRAGATLVGSATGLMQLQRTCREDGGGHLVSSDETALLAALRTPEAPRPASVPSIRQAR